MIEECIRIEIDERVVFLKKIVIKFDNNFYCKKIEFKKYCFDYCYEVLFREDCEKMFKTHLIELQKVIMKLFNKPFELLSDEDGR